MSSRKARRSGKTVFSQVQLRLEELERRDLPSSTLPSAGFYTDPNDFASDQIIVRWLDGAPAASPVAEGAENLGNNTWAINLVDGVTVADAVAYYSRLAGVDFAQPDYIIHIALTPDDTSFGSLWGLHNTGQSGGTSDADIDAPEAWDYQTGSSSIIVAVIDTGVDYLHPDLTDNMWQNPGEVAGNGVDDDANGIVDDIYGANFIGTGTATGNARDDHGHGTHVAGTIGATGNNATGVVGVAWDVQIMALKFLNSSGSGSTADAVQAINYAVAQGAKILNNSWGGGGFDSALASAINSARTNGVIVVAAAGNSASDNDTTPHYPSNYDYDNVVSVASTDRFDSLSSFSNYGATTVDLAAPGSSIYSTYPSNLDSANPYRTFSGTSMATPHVAGALALVWSANPTYTYTQVIDAILNNVDSLSSLSGLVATGGRLNVGNAIINTQPTEPAGPKVTLADWTGNSTTSYDHVRLTFSVAIDPTTFTIDDVTLTGPTGQSLTVTSVQVVDGSGDTQFDITFATQTTPGNYTLAVGPEVYDTQSRPMDQNKNGTAGEVPADRFQTKFTVGGTSQFATGTVNAAIKDLQTTTVSFTIDTHLTISDLNIKINIKHTWDSDLTIKLVSPGAKTVTLANRRGGSGDNFTNTTFDDEASVSIASGVAPFTGSYRPEGLLSTFDKTDLYGTWKLQVTDSFRYDTGTILDFTIIATAAGGPTGPVTINVEPVEADPTAAPPSTFDGGEKLADIAWVAGNSPGAAQAESPPARVQAPSKWLPTAEPAVPASDWLTASSDATDGTDDDEDEESADDLLNSIFVFLGR